MTTAILPKRKIRSTEYDLNNVQFIETTRTDKKTMYRKWEEGNIGYLLNVIVFDIIFFDQSFNHKNNLMPT